MGQLRMHAGIARQKIKDVLAGNKPLAPSDAYKALPWVSETQRFSYALFTAALYPLYIARQALPAPLRRKLLFFVRGIDATKSLSAFRSAYIAPESPTATGSSYELYVCPARREGYPDLAVRVHKNVKESDMQHAYAQATHSWYERTLPEFTSWQGSGVVSLGSKQKHHITVSEYVRIHADLCAGHSKSALIQLRKVLNDCGKETQQQFALIIERMRSLAQQGIYLDIGGMNNLVICTPGTSKQPCIRMVDTGLIGVSSAIDTEMLNSLHKSGVCTCTVTAEGGNRSWSAQKYNEYISKLEDISRTFATKE